MFHFRIAINDNYVNLAKSQMFIKVHELIHTTGATFLWERENGGLLDTFYERSLQPLYYNNHYIIIIVRNLSKNLLFRSGSFSFNNSTNINWFNILCKWNKNTWKKNRKVQNNCISWLLNSIKQACAFLYKSCVQGRLWGAFSLRVIKKNKVSLPVYRLLGL